jgi:ATP-dependent DNA ligase
MDYLYPCKPSRLERASSLFLSLNNDPLWVGEAKRNGWRCLAMQDYVGALTLWTRHKTVIPDKLPELRALLAAQLPEGTLVDGELLERRTKQVKGEYYVFDILLLKGGR